MKSRYIEPLVEEQELPSKQGSDWTGWVGRTDQVSESENGILDSEHGFQPTDGLLLISELHPFKAIDELLCQFIPYKPLAMVVHSV